MTVFSKKRDCVLAPTVVSQGIVPGLPSVAGFGPELPAEVGDRNAGVFREQEGDCIIVA